MLEYFCKGIVPWEFVAEGETVTDVFYLNVFERLGKRTVRARSG